MEPWQTRATEFHPYMVDTIDALPESLRGAAAAALPPGIEMVSALVVPLEYRAEGTSDSHPVAEQALIFTDGGALHVQAGLQDEPAPPPSICNPKSLLCIRSSHLLLYGELELLGAVQGQPVKLAMQFNAIGWRLMDAEWRDLVGKAIGMPTLAPDEEAAASEQTQALLQSVPAKFAEGLRKYGLYTGETLLGTVFQPAVWTQTLGLFDQQVTPNTLLALTDASVLVLEEESALVRKSEQFGLIITRIPRAAIADVQAAAHDAMQELTLALARGGATAERRLLLEQETAQAWLELWQSHGTDQSKWAQMTNGARSVACLPRNTQHGNHWLIKPTCPI